MTCPYSELAQKLELLNNLDTGGEGFIFKPSEIDTIIEALRYTSEHKCPQTCSSEDK